MQSLENLPKEVKTELKNVSRIAEYLWNREWAERNAGNISINLSAHFKDFSIPVSSNFIPCLFPSAAADITLFVSGTGCYLRSLIDRIDEAACIMHINSEATGYHIIWGGLSSNFKPTSELISHIKIHCFNKVKRPSYNAVLHTHPIELIVLSHHELFHDIDKFNHSLWKMCPEIRVFVPKGIYCAPYELPSSEKLADVTIKGLETRDVILWEKHGALASGENIEKAFDYLDVANKGAKMLLLAWSAGFEPKGLSKDQMNDLEHFI